MIIDRDRIILFFTGLAIDYIVMVYFYRRVAIDVKKYSPQVYQATLRWWWFKIFFGGRIQSSWRLSRKLSATGDTYLQAQAGRLRKIDIVSYVAAIPEMGILFAILYL